jgi:hypothetical protein
MLGHDENARVQVIRDRGADQGHSGQVARRITDQRHLNHFRYELPSPSKPAGLSETMQPRSAAGNPPRAASFTERAPKPGPWQTDGEYGA